MVLTSVWKTDDWQELVGVRLLHTPPTKERMYKVTEREREIGSFESLDKAMMFAKMTGSFVTITGPDFEVCGRFGVDSVVDGHCPDGVVYDWNKASRIGEPRRR